MINKFIKHRAIVNKCIIGTTMAILFQTIVFSQQDYNRRSDFLKSNSVWAFADYAGLDFNTGTAVSIRTALYGGIAYGEGNCAVSDPNTGALQFYTNGAACWNAGHIIMPNGTGLLGNGSPNKNGEIQPSTLQGALIVPLIDSPGKYYLFSLISEGRVSLHGSLFYSIVDMSLDSGRGDIISARKNISLDTTPLTEAMIAVPGDCHDIWLLVHTATNIPQYKAYHITAKGIDPYPVLSSGVLPRLTTSTGIIGAMSISPNRELLGFGAVMTSKGRIEVCKFNSSTGEISSPVNISTGAFFGATGVAFSPNSKLLYASCFSSPSSHLLQYDISIWDSLAISNSIDDISIVPSAGGSLRLYNDSIYVSGIQHSSIGRINVPNALGMACNYQTSAISLLPGTYSRNMSMPTEVVYPYPVVASYTKKLDTLICSGWTNGIELRPTKLIENFIYEWNVNVTDTVLRIDTAGTYWVTYTNGCDIYVDSFILRGEELEPPVVTVNLHELGTTLSYTTYQWLKNGEIIPGAINRFYIVSENSDYQVVVGVGADCKDTSAIYPVTNITSIKLVEIKDQIHVYPNPVKDLIYIEAPVKIDVGLVSIEGKIIRNEKDVVKLSVQDLSKGIYFLHIRNQEGRLIKVEKFVKSE